MRDADATEHNDETVARLEDFLDWAGEVDMGELSPLGRILRRCRTRLLASTAAGCRPAESRP